MADQTPPNTSSDEIDLAHLIKMLGNGFRKLGNFFLRIFIYLKRNAIVLGVLILLGVLSSLALKMLVPKKLTTEVIVRPNFESKNYLYNVIEEIAANVKAKDTAFFGALSITAAELDGFEIVIEPIVAPETVKEEAENELKYLELLQNFKEENFVVDILRSELSKKSLIDHKISFFYRDEKSGVAIAQKIMAYINSNPYFEDLKKTYQDNARLRIETNNVLLGQIDVLIDNYSKAMLEKDDSPGSETVYLENENSLNVPSLLSLKNRLTKEIEEKNLELATQTNMVSIINFGKTHELKKTFINQRIVVFPLILVLAFFLFSIIQYLNRKSKEIQ